MKTDFQASLPGLEPAPLTDRLLLVLKPPPDVAERLFALGAALRRAHGLTGTQIDPERLHFTLYWYGDYAGDPPPSVVAAARAAAGLVSATPFEMTVDRAMSFEAGPHKAPLVLFSDGEATALKAFRADIERRMLGVNLRSRVGFSQPHISLLRDVKRVPPQPFEPVTWTAGEFSLVRSLLGRSRYETIETWPLRG